MTRFLGLIRPDTGRQIRPNPGEFVFQNIPDRSGHKLAALDSDIGDGKDFYFDDKTWVILYFTGPSRDHG